ncbi:MAG: nickel-responsive transcriptional regulator NikR [Ectothiorhodospiraceae bacterium]|nr:nickel-responsive transcriptional regulator NikR [Ectothiorhodospiraceae bacterium]MCH8502693.1 nickel-responsive transcriptional regulator NikR [Ectothiorhodospiraceae bacterium]
MTERFTVSLDKGLAEAFDAYRKRRGYSSRSEAVRDLLRQLLASTPDSGADDEPCLGVLTYVYDHHAWGLGQRLIADHHSHFHLGIATLHVHLDHDNCLETVVLRGPRAQLQAFAEETMTRRGVRHGHLEVVPLALVQTG